MRVLTWNVAGRVTRQPEQAAVVAAAAADVVLLQEVTRRTLPLWRASLRDAGLPFAASPLEVPGCGAQRKRPLGVLLAARSPVTPLPAPADVPWPERVQSCLVDGVEVIDVHSPIAPAPDLAKVRFHEAMAAYLADRPDGPIVLGGDLNTPRREHPDGDVMTFAYASSGKLREERGRRWDDAERALVWGLRQRGWVDAFRHVHGWEVKERSWTFARDKGGWRLDHVLVRGLEVRACAYAHDWRRAGLSDHSALVADLT